MDFYADVMAFHRKFKLDRPNDMFNEHFIEMRMRFFQEELEELALGIEKKDLVEVLDAFVDLVYITVGMAELMGLPFNEAWKIVHESNMWKIRATVPTKRKTTFDVIKPPGWEPPDIAKVLRDAGFDIKVIK